jgi:hypothetical protein
LTFAGQNFGDGGGQSGLAVVDVANCTDVYMSLLRRNFAFAMKGLLISYFYYAA